jgi:hypothetical protein
MICRQCIMKENYLIFVGTRGARLDVCEKRIIFRNVTFLNLVQPM